jgi:multidrug efflux pump subunit AcrA (membrane-fusion protein)
MPSRKTLLVLVLVILIIAGGGYAYYSFFYEKQEVIEEATLQTSRTRQGDLIIYASGSGTVIAGDEIELGFGTSGSIAEILVQVGDEVHAGDVLAVQADREQLEATVASDQLTLRNAEKALQDLYDDADLVTSLALLDLAQAQETLEDVEYTWYVMQEGNRASQSTIDAAKAELVLAQNRLDQAQEEYNKQYGKSKDNPARAQAISNLAAAQANYDAKLRNLNWYLGAPSEIDQALLDADVAMAKARLAEAERDYERVKDGPDPDEIVKAELELVNAEAKLAVSQSNLEESIILAPVDGTILSVSAEEGQSVSGSFITMANLNQPYLEIFLDETDLGNIAVGYEAEVIFDALPDTIFTGKVVQVDPSLYRSGQVSTVRGIVVLDETTVVDLSKLLIGMNASVDVIGGRAEGAVLVPVEALRELSPGEFAVFVEQGGELEMRIVEVGLMDFTFAEVKSGLEVGETVSTGIVETQ